MKLRTQKILFIVFVLLFYIWMIFLFSKCSGDEYVKEEGKEHIHWIDSLKKDFLEDSVSIPDSL